MSSARRWLIWLVLLALTLTSAVWVSEESDEGDLLADFAEERDQGRQVLGEEARAMPAPKDQRARASTPSRKRRPAAEAEPRPANPFAARSWYIPPPPPKPEPPSKPMAPPLPFRYLGMLESGEGNWLVQLAHRDEAILAADGDVIGDIYRLEGLRDGDLIFTYLPLGTRQFLPAHLDSDP